jgi:hypothetical protein
MVFAGAITAAIMGGLKQFFDYHGFGYFTLEASEIKSGH